MFFPPQVDQSNGKLYSIQLSILGIVCQIDPRFCAECKVLAESMEQCFLDIAECQHMVELSGTSEELLATVLAILQFVFFRIAQGLVSLFT